MSWLRSGQSSVLKLCEYDQSCLCLYCRVSLLVVNFNWHNAVFFDYPVFDILDRPVEAVIDPFEGS